MNSKKNKNIIVKVIKDSIAEEVGLRSGYEIVSINGRKIKDNIDYKFLIYDENIILAVKKDNGEHLDCEIEKEYDEELGIDFENLLMDKINTCEISFCFVLLINYLRNAKIDVNQRR